MKRPLFLLPLLLAGCATVDCNSDWLAIGQRDGRLGANPQAELYAKRCPGNVDAARYDEGWRAGYDSRPRIMSF